MSPTRNPSSVPMAWTSANQTKIEESQPQTSLSLINIKEILNDRKAFLEETIAQYNEELAVIKIALLGFDVIPDYRPTPYKPSDDIPF